MNRLKYLYFNYYSHIIKISIRELTILKTIGYIALVGYIPTKWYRPSQDLQLYNYIY
nr:MAG TPA: hypothetical protein [Caudoviricetes sp.]